MNDQFLTLTGAIEFNAIRTDGVTEPVKVHQIKIAYMQKYLEAQSEESKVIDLCCARNPGWSLTLTDESFQELIVLCEKVNASFFGPWQARRLDRMERLMPGFKAKMMGVSPSQDTSQNSPSKQG